MAHDLEYFLDFDMAILGADWDEYVLYTLNIRKEYRIYPDFLYYKGRKDFLANTLQKKNIFHTQLFKLELEDRARQNIARELKEEIK